MDLDEAKYGAGGGEDEQFMIEESRMLDGFLFGFTVSNVDPFLCTFPCPQRPGSR